MIVKGFSDKSKACSLKLKNIFESFISDYHKQISYEIELCQNQNKQFDDLIQSFIEFREKFFQNGI